MLQAYDIIGFRVITGNNDREVAMKTKAENRERIARNVRNFRERKAREGFIRLELYLSQDMISGIFEALGPDGHVYGPAGAVMRLLEAKTN
jgi:hypothetical protein